MPNLSSNLPDPLLGGGIKGGGVGHPDPAKDLAFFILRFFAKEAQNDRVCGFVILNAVKDLTFHLKILRKRGSE